MENLRGGLSKLADLEAADLEAADLEFGEIQ